jgi:hypothetical protein
MSPQLYNRLSDLGDLHIDCRLTICGPPCLDMPGVGRQFISLGNIHIGVPAAMPGVGVAVIEATVTVPKTMLADSRITDERKVSPVPFSVIIPMDLIIVFIHHPCAAQLLQ